MKRRGDELTRLLNCSYQGSPASKSASQKTICFILGNVPRRNSTNGVMSFRSVRTKPRSLPLRHNATGSWILVHISPRVLDKQDVCRCLIDLWLAHIAFIK